MSAGRASHSEARNPGAAAPSRHGGDGLRGAGWRRVALPDVAKRAAAGGFASLPAFAAALAQAAAAITGALPPPGPPAEGGSATGAP